MRLRINPKWLPHVTAGVGLATGAGVGYLIAKYRFDKELDSIIDKFGEGPVIGRLTDVDVDEEGVTVTGVIRDEWKNLVQGPELKGLSIGIPETERKLGEEFARGIVNPQAELANPNIGKTVDRTNVFDRTEDQWDEDAEREGRSPNAPYVIRLEEFHNREMGFPQETLTWYEGDKILANDDGMVIYGPEKVVGQLVWGHGSNDPDTVYIRNEELRGEYEVVRNQGSYQQVVLGLQAEDDAEEDDLRHSATVPRFRQYRD